MDTDEVSPELTCSSCMTEVSEDDARYITYSSDVSCVECSRYCEHCEDTGWESDSWYYVDQSEMWCEGCAENHANYCDDCNEYHTGSSFYVQDSNSSICENCIESFTYCEDCDEYYASACYEHDEERVIHDYSYRPDPIFHSMNDEDRLFFGIEIEVEAGHNRSESAQYASRLEELSLAYLKSDGSLDCGFEIVTHPMTHEFYKTEAYELWNTLENLRSRNDVKVRAWDARTAGLHIHISRTGFNGGAHMHRFLRLVYDNQTLYEKLAGRSSSRWAKFDDAEQGSYDGPRDDDGNFTWVSRRNLKNKLENPRNSDRYSAINTQNHATLEMRIFRSSVNSTTVKAFIDLAHASVEYTRTLSVKDVREGALEDWRFVKYIHDKADVYPELATRVAKSVTLSEQIG